jgi:poly(glycerol-phosphate) alpha-glucosyltransferase
VHFLGPQFGAARAAAYRNAQAFILPSFSEGLPMAVLEAWAHRLPVLMTRQCHLPEGFAAHAAMPLEPSPDSIAIGLENLFRAAAKDREEMGRRGRELVTARFSWSRVAASLHEVYRWVLGGGAKPECVVTA